jgi:membrane fusion protein (multidrug efflux system)
MNELPGRPQEFDPRREMPGGEGASSPEGVESADSAARLARFRLRPPHNGQSTILGPHLAPEPDEMDDEDETAPSQKRGVNWKRWLFGVILVAALLCAGLALARYISVGRYMYWTDDAYIRTDLAIVSPKISGYVEDVRVVDNQHVKAGQVLARIDAGDYQLAVAAARQKIQTQDATIARIKAQAEAQKAMVAQARSQLDSASAEKARAEADLKRVQALNAADFATHQRFETSVADRAKAAAGVAGAEAALAGAGANLVVLQSQAEEASRLRDEMATAQARAERDLGFAEIKAPFDGVVGNRVVEPGQFAQPGARLMALAPDDSFYVEANFKETQLDRLAPGQKAKVRIDAYDGRAFDGEVESIAPASGSQYSLLPPENATGNFTKITQRFPVRIKLSPEARGLLRAGMSVVVEVDTRAAGASN